MLSLSAHGNRYFDDSKLLEGKIQKYFLRIGEASKRIKGQGGLPAVSPHTTGNIAKSLPHQARYQPRHHSVSPPLQIRHLGFQLGINKTRSGGEIRIIVNQRLNEHSDVCGIELPVCIDANDEIKASVNPVTQCGRKGGTDPSRLRMLNHESTGPLRLLGGAVGTTVVYYQYLDARHTGEIARDRADDLRNRSRLI
jgi:hypothetical protein